MGEKDILQTADRTRLILEKKSRSKDRVKMSFDCTFENYERLKDLSERTNYNRNELINKLLQLAIENVEIV